MARYNQKDLTTLREMNKEMERLKNITDGVGKDTLSYKQSLEYIKQLSADIKSIEDKRSKIQEQYQRKASNLSLEKSITKLQKQGLGTIQKRLSLTSDIEYLNKLITNGTDDQVKDAIKYNKFLDDINAGLSLAEVNQRMATEHFGDMQGFAENIVKELNKSGDILEQMGKEKKFADMIDQVKDTLGLIDLKKTFTFAGLLAVAAKFAGRILEVKQSLGTSAIESVRLASNISLAGATAKVLGGNAEEAEAAVTAMVDEFGSLSVVSLETSVSLGKLVASSGLTGANAAKLLKSMDAISSASIETNIALIKSTEELALAEGVAPGQLLNDIALSSM